MAKTNQVKISSSTHYEGLIGLPSEQLGEMVDATPSCHKIVMRDGSLLSMNKRGLKIIGANGLADVQGQSVYPLIHPEDRERFRAFNERICGGAQESLMFRILTLNGKVRWMESWAGPYELSNGEVAQLAITNDVTARVKTQTTIEQQRVDLERAFRMSSLGALAAGLSHEINNPLSIIQGLAETLLMSVESREVQPADIIQDLTEISATAARISKVISELKNFSDEPMATHWEQAHLPNVLAGVQSLIHTSQQSAPIRMHLETKNDGLVCTSVNLLQQSMFHLISYAQTAFEDTPNPQINWKIGQKDQGSPLIIRCTLNRPNSEPATLEQSILNPFLDSRTQSQHATLGLSSMRRMLLRHGGSLAIGTRTEETTFVVTIPGSGWKNT